MLNVDKISYWERKTYFENIDYVVIGAGIVGYSTALHLKELNPDVKILIIERGLLPSGASSKNAGFACFGSPTELMDDIKRFGEDNVWETVELRINGLENLKSMLGANTFDLQINGSWDLIRVGEETIFSEIRDQIPYFNDKLKQITGASDVYSVDHEASSKFGLNGICGSFHNRLEGQIDTSKLNKAFYSLVIEKDINVLFGIEAMDIDSNQGHAIISTNSGQIKCKSAAICTNGFAKQFVKDEDILPARAQVLITEPIADLKIKGTFHYQQGYYYFRNIDNRILLGGGRNLDFEGETTTILDTTDQILDHLKHLLNTVVYPNGNVKVDHTWAGIMGVGNTKKPIIKQIKNSVYCGVRLGGMGVAIGTLVGKELAELINSSE